ncbi:MAG TPA: hypothetical protein PK453_23725 [Leptospiraceae bacterium]|nr:hypothetical protein [Leptospiraceae bacterium]HMY67820.1 hypothetical protein [Leptospiraceae bacterium]HNF16684.1 hypothetical protein [Leptospiraceae bacterium]HNF23555.1 hypothetical protein [Leptospiraceae bacterium]HNI97430.1 hypothetical protein [Leptospiraceae bacterium]
MKKSLFLFLLISLIGSIAAQDEVKVPDVVKKAIQKFTPKYDLKNCSWSVTGNNDDYYLCEILLVQEDSNSPTVSLYSNKNGRDLSGSYSLKADDFDKYFPAELLKKVRADFASQDSSPEKALVDLAAGGKIKSIYFTANFDESSFLEAGYTEKGKVISKIKKGGKGGG